VERRDEQHMHDMRAEDLILTVLPFFHVGGSHPDHAGAASRRHGHIHARFAPDLTLAAIAQDRPTLTVLVPATIQAVIGHPELGQDRPHQPARDLTGSTQVPVPLIDAVEARGVPVLQVYGSTETCPVAVYTRIGGDRRARHRPVCRACCAKLASSTTRAARCRPVRPAKWRCAGPMCS